MLRRSVVAYSIVLIGCAGDHTTKVADIAGPNHEVEDTDVMLIAQSDVRIKRPATTYFPNDTSIILQVSVASSSRRRTFGGITWRSSDPTKAAVGRTTGEVDFGSEGSAWIVAESNAGSDSVALTSISRSPIAVTPSAPSVATGATIQLQTGTTDLPLEWRTSNSAVVTVSTSGIVTAVAPGVATVTVVKPLGATGSATVTVTAPVSAAPTTPPPILPPTTGSVSFVPPTPPQAHVDVTYPAMTGRVLRVAAGGDLQSALDMAQSGDEVVLARGTVFTGNFTLPAKSGTGWVVVRAETGMPAAGTRATPALMSGAPRVLTPNADAAFRAAPGAKRWRLVGFEVTQAPVAINYGLVVLGQGNETSVAPLPSQIVLDRMYIHGTPTTDLQRCVTFNGIALAVIDSWLGDCHGKGFDAQGIVGWNGPGPFLIENNRIEGSGQAIMFGGADPTITNASPSDITIRRNHLYKPLSWAGGRWSVKATFELKHGKRVLFEGNVLENHWADAQTGFAILFQTLADDNRSWAWTTVQDVLVQHNVIRRSTGGANILARVAYHGGQMPTNPTSRIALVNNFWDEVGKDPIQGHSGRVFQLLADLRDVSVVNNTVTLSGSASHALVLDGTPQQRTTFVNNVLPNSEYGIMGSGQGIGTNAINYYLPDGRVAGNVLPRQPAHIYPASNFFPADFSTIEFAAPPTDFSLKSTNAFYSGVHGTIGIDAARLASLITGVVP